MKVKEWICLGKTKLEQEKFSPICNIPLFVKPEGGLWLSPYTPKEKFVSPWHEWCNSARFLSNEVLEGVIVTLTKDAKLYIIDSQRDLVKLIDEVGEAESIPEFEFKFHKIPNFEVAAKKYDGIYLTWRGQGETRIPWKNPQYNLYGWDVASALVLHFDVIKSQREFKKISLEE